MQRDYVRLAINGEIIDVKGADSFLTLAQFLRYRRQLPGTKIVCAEGDCGACTVLVSHFRNQTWTPFKTINSCIAPVYLQDMACVVSVEGLQSHGELSTVQEKMVEHHGGQCGYCTPGMVCSLAGLAEDCKNKNLEISEKKARNYLTGNLCRCTGYEPILAAAQNMDLKKWIPLATRYLNSNLQKAMQDVCLNEVLLQHENKSAFVPATIDQAIKAKNKNPQLRLVSGATDLGVVANKGKLFLDQVMSLANISELNQIQITQGGQIKVGPLVTLAKLQSELKNELPELNRLIDIFASPQIKNQGTLVGNIINGSPIGDTIPAMLVLEAQLELSSARGLRIVLLSQFYKAYKVMDILPDEICTGVIIPTLEKNCVTRFYKVSMRKDLDISAVTFAAFLRFKENKIEEARIAMGGVGPTVARLKAIEAMMCGQNFSQSLFENLSSEIRKYISPISDLRASKEYRFELAKNMFTKLYHETVKEVRS